MELNVLASLQTFDLKPIINYLTRERNDVIKLIGNTVAHEHNS